MEKLFIEAKSVAALIREIKALDHETRAVIVATENSEPWATMDISPMTGTRRAIFPNHAGGFRGDTRKRGQSGVHFNAENADHSINVVANRARKMA